MSRSIRWIIFSLTGIIILFIVLKLAGVTGTDEEIKVTTEKVGKRTIIETVNAGGKIYPETEIKISSDISGEVTGLYVQEGDSVKKGQTLAHINNFKIKSPIKGTVLLINIKKGERVTGNSMMAGTEIMRIADLNNIQVKVDVGENDISKINIGDSATVEVDAYNNRKFKGVVTQIAGSTNGSASLQPATAGTDVTNYKVHIRLLPESYKDLLDPAEYKSFPFRSGMSAGADIETKTHKNRLAVPINAVTTRDKNDSTGIEYETGEEDENSIDRGSSDIDQLEEVVFVLQKDGTVKKVKVTTDIQDVNYIEILSGVNEGDKVITGPYDAVSKTLKPGDKVKVVTRSELFEKKKKN